MEQGDKVSNRQYLERLNEKRGGWQGGLWHRYHMVWYQVLSEMIVGTTTTTRSVPTDLKTSVPQCPYLARQRLNGTPLSLYFLNNCKYISKATLTKLLSVPTPIGWVPVPLLLVPGSTIFAEFGARYHPSGTMVPLPCHPPQKRAHIVNLRISMTNENIFNILIPE